MAPTRAQMVLIPHMAEGILTTSQTKPAGNVDSIAKRERYMQSNKEERNYISLSLEYYTNYVKQRAQLWPWPYTH